MGLTVALNWQAVEANSRDWWDGIRDTSQFGKVAARSIVPHWPLLVALMVAGGSMTGSLFSADAWNNVTFTAGEVKNRAGIYR